MSRTQQGRRKRLHSAEFPRSAAALAAGHPSISAPTRTEDTVLKTDGCRRFSKPAVTKPHSFGRSADACHFPLNGAIFRDEVLPLTRTMAASVQKSLTKSVASRKRVFYLVFLSRSNIFFTRNYHSYGKITFSNP